MGKWERARRFREGRKRGACGGTARSIGQRSVAFGAIRSDNGFIREGPAPRASPKGTSSGVKPAAVRLTDEASLLSKFNIKAGRFDLKCSEDGVVFRLPTFLLNLHSVFDAKTPHPSASRPPSPPGGRLAICDAFRFFCHHAAVLFLSFFCK